MWVAKFDILVSKMEASTAKGQQGGSRGEQLSAFDSSSEFSVTPTREDDIFIFSFERLDIEQVREDADGSKGAAHREELDGPGRGIFFHTRDRASYLASLPGGRSLG